MSCCFKTSTGVIGQMRIRDHQGSASIIADEKNCISTFPGTVVLYRCSTERKGKGIAVIIDGPAAAATRSPGFARI